MSRAVVAPPRLSLLADTATELMSPNPVSIRRDATVPEAVALLTDHNFSAAPVIDEAGRPVGVISKSDILVHNREYAAHLGPVDSHDFNSPTARREGFQVELTDPTTVEEIMTPGVFAVRADATAAEVVREMVTLHVHRIFVTDETGTLVGVISTLDVLKRLKG